MSHSMSNDEIISKYTRKQAIEDGVLVDLSELAREAGIKFPVAATQGVFNILSDTRSPGQDLAGRTWDMFMIMRLEAKNSTGDEIHFAPFFVMDEEKAPVPFPMWAKCGPGDEGEPVITIMLPDED